MCLISGRGKSARRSLAACSNNVVPLTFEPLANDDDDEFDNDKFVYGSSL
jgi:hypothetical protein